MIKYTLNRKPLKSVVKTTNLGYYNWLGLRKLPVWIWKWKRMFIFYFPFQWKSK